MDNKIEVLNRLLDEINLSLQQVCDRIDMLSNQKQEISQNLKELYNNEDNLNKRKKVLEEIINDENLMSGCTKTSTNDVISPIESLAIKNKGQLNTPTPYEPHPEMITTGAGMTVMAKKGATITSPLYPGESIATEIHMTKSSIVQGAAKEILKQMERDHKYGNV